MSEDEIDYYHAPETPQRATQAPLSLSDEIEHFLARKTGDLSTRELLAQALALLRHYERERALYWNRLEWCFSRFMGGIDDGK